MRLLIIIGFIILACIFPALWGILGWVLGAFLVLLFLGAIFGD
jgi:hypothetical protein